MRVFLSFPLLLMILFSDVIKEERTIFQRETNLEDEAKEGNRTTKKKHLTAGAVEGKKGRGLQDCFERLYMTRYLYSVIQVEQWERNIRLSHSGSDSCMRLKCRIEIDIQ